MYQIINNINKSKILINLNERQWKKYGGEMKEREMKAWRKKWKWKRQCGEIMAKMKEKRRNRKKAAAKLAKKKKKWWRRRRSRSNQRRSNEKWKAIINEIMIIIRIVYYSLHSTTSVPVYSIWPSDSIFWWRLMITIIILFILIFILTIYLNPTIDTMILCHWHLMIQYSIHLLLMTVPFPVVLTLYPDYLTVFYWWYSSYSTLSIQWRIWYSWSDAYLFIQYSVVTYIWHSLPTVTIRYRLILLFYRIDAWYWLFIDDIIWRALLYLLRRDVTTFNAIFWLISVSSIVWRENIKRNIGISIKWRHQRNRNKQHQHQWRIKTAWKSIKIISISMAYRAHGIIWRARLSSNIISSSISAHHHRAASCINSAAASKYRARKRQRA